MAHQQAQQKPNVTPQGLEMVFIQDQMFDIPELKSKHVRQCSLSILRWYQGKALSSASLRSSKILKFLRILPNHIMKRFINICVHDCGTQTLKIATGAFPVFPSIHFNLIWRCQLKQVGSNVSWFTYGCCYDQIKSGSSFLGDTLCRNI